MVKKANKRMWILRRLSFLGASQGDLIDVYTKQIRSIVEYAVPAWQGGISLSEKSDLERIQKAACHIILGKDYLHYEQALEALQLESLEDRRNKLSLKFALKAEKHPKFRNWFKLHIPKRSLRKRKNKYEGVKSYSGRFTASPISFLTELLNTYYRGKS